MPGIFHQSTEGKKKMKKFLLPALIAGALALAAQNALAVDFQVANGDGTCPSGTVMVTPDVAYTYKSQVCPAIGNNASARIAGGGAMSSASGGCTVRLKDATAQPVTLCDKIVFQVANGDNTCPAGTRLATVQEAALFNSQACGALSGNQWYIARLAGGGAIGGSGYNCAVNPSESKALGNSLCTTGSVQNK